MFEWTSLQLQPVKNKNKSIIKASTSSRVNSRQWGVKYRPCLTCRRQKCPNILTNVPFFLYLVIYKQDLSDHEIGHVLKWSIHEFILQMFNRETLKKFQNFNKRKACWNSCVRSMISLGLEYNYVPRDMAVILISVIKEMDGMCVRARAGIENLIFAKLSFYFYPLYAFRAISIIRDNWIFRSSFRTAIFLSLHILL